jgi:hypothetical protein
MSLYSCEIWCKLKINTPFNVVARHGVSGASYSGMITSGFLLFSASTKSTIIIALTATYGYPRTIFWAYSSPTESDPSLNHATITPSLTSDEIDFRVAINKKASASVYYKDVLSSSWIPLFSNNTLTGTTWYLQEALFVPEYSSNMFAWSEYVRIETPCPITWNASLGPSGPS